MLLGRLRVEGAEADRNMSAVSGGDSEVLDSAQSVHCKRDAVMRLAIDLAALRRCWVIGWLSVISTLSAGCVSFAPALFEMSRDQLYPHDWPDIVGAGEDCQLINGTYTNKGVSVDALGRTHAAWLTDLWSWDKQFTARAEKETKIHAMRECDRARVMAQAHSSVFWGGAEGKKATLTITPSSSGAATTPDQLERCESLQFSLQDFFPFGYGACARNKLIVQHGEATWLLAIAGDGSLVARWEKVDFTVFALTLGAVPLILPFPGWERFERVP
jgi:hypothetical protein